MSPITPLTLSLTLLAVPGGDASAASPPSATQDYAALLKAHVRNGRVNYDGVEKDRARLDRYVDHVAKASLPKSRNARIGFYIDAYNALVLKAVLDNGKPRSVLDVKGFFNAQTHTVAGKSVTLDALEKKVLNPYAKDPRTHFVLVCGAVGCPILESTPFLGSNVDKRMDRATRRYLKSPHGAKISGGSVRLSKIFDWYKGDFGGPEGVKTFVAKHVPADKAAAVTAGKVEFIDYNWTLNQQ